MMITNVLTVVYVVCLLILASFALASVMMLVMYLRHRRDPVVPVEVTEWPSAAIQLPIYNERYVVERLLKACAELDYPRDRLVIQILDDSNDDTSELVAELVEHWRAQGVDMRHIRRDSRQGFKAGALAYGMTLLDAEMVGVLDADFMPPPNFLKRAISHLLSDPRLAAVQGRWGHLNSEENSLTRAVTMAIDGHFVIEQMARNRSGWLMNFNGSGGVWRSSAIRESGGWQDATLSEDMDLSYRAQLMGWRLLYLPDLVVPGEIPPVIMAYKQQQARWAQGGTQCFRRLILPVWRHPRLTVMQKIMATMHLSQYIMHPIMIVVILLTPPLLLSQSLQHLNLGLLGIVGLGPPMVFVLSQQALYLDWRYRLIRSIPLLFVIGTGIAYSNSRAVMRGILNRHDEFRRTPKYASRIRDNIYGLRLNSGTFWELMLCGYAAWGAWTAFRLERTLVLYLLVYSIAFGVVALWGLRDSLSTRRAL
ncbi:MAG: glycosyltransferase [Anaerolineae bacterium]|nr:glycosyltransferase [Anaerolineae bacterium]